jgi:DNA-binding beta-propeller fold protein YncE
MLIGIAVPDDRFAYAANMGDDTISVIDIRRGISSTPPTQIGRRVEQVGRSGCPKNVYR